MPTTISPKVFQARINLGGTFGNPPEPTTPTTLWLRGGLKNNEDWRSEMEKGEEATKVFELLVEMVDASMEDAYFLLSATTTSRRLNRNLQLIEEEA